MKVLMFGWEFPPHISGGLGTACYGLTHSLGKEDVDVLFVVPKLHGDEPAERMQLINASEVPIKASEVRIKRPTQSSSLNSPLASNIRLQTFITPGEKNTSEHQTRISYIEVPSGLSAYQSPDADEERYSIQRWNYQFGQSQDQATLRVHKQRRSGHPTSSKNEGEMTYAFSGAYGPDLLNEVERYAEVAREIAKRFSFDVI
ncbi:MAG TPA: glycogen/starch synthase, partial [Chryseosolibacter sp.]|nr:glycogen/starch synthase [Chryseosolibacter sp.]